MSSDPPPIFAPPPQPPSDRGGLLVALALFGVGLAVLIGVLAGGWRLVSSPGSPAPPPIVLASTPAASNPVVGAIPAATIVAGRPSSAQAADRKRFRSAPAAQVTSAWEASFYPLYTTAQNTFAVNWLLLASIHKQETAFSTAPSTYHGLNYAGCCGGPMQFNVRNRPVSTWKLVRGAYRYAARPAVYGHATALHPSIYDDYDSVMAAAWLLSSDGAGVGLDAAAWRAAYAYYGHDATGVTYADQVLARAIGWSQHGFCINCGVSPALERAVHAAWGAPALAQLGVSAPPVSPRPAPRHRPRPRALVARAARAP